MLIVFFLTVVLAVCILFNLFYLQTLRKVRGKKNEISRIGSTWELWFRNQKFKVSIAALAVVVALVNTVDLTSGLKLPPSLDMGNILSGEKFVLLGKVLQRLPALSGWAEHPLAQMYSAAQLSFSFRFPTIPHAKTCPIMLFSYLILPLFVVHLLIVLMVFTPPAETFWKLISLDTKIRISNYF